MMYQGLLLLINLTGWGQIHGKFSARFVASVFMEDGKFYFLFYEKMFFLHDNDLCIPTHYYGNLIT